MNKQDEKGKSSRPSVVNLAKHFQGIDFPANKQDLIEQAKKNGAEENVMSMLDQMEDREYAA